VRLYAEAGEEEKVAAMLAAGRKSIAPLHAFHQVPAFCQLAEAQVAAGRAQEAENTWAEAMQVAVRNPNPSSTHLGAAQVAFSVARAGCELPAAVAELLDSPAFTTEPKRRDE
jgi:hypothetical protein